MQLLTYNNILPVMSNQIISQVAGQLTQDKDLPVWWKSQPLEIPFFDNSRLAIIFSGFEPTEYLDFFKEADGALANFLQLTPADRLSLSDLAYKNCIDFLDAVDVDEADEPLRAIKDKTDIWKFIYPTVLYVTRRPYKEQDMYVQIACECVWEQEHGLQLVFRQGKKLTRISDQDGHLTEADAYGKPDEEDELLSGF
jgi:hypothetical protein